ncbi:protein GREB1-like [Sinocyclocheilus grahami]|uniref:protein GREB1-like n=1 Tax=Sinocyclocheilus grahami TaxID=75366 RepID=UPI0007AD1A72|nr:PREDICTED: protein GREB1-like [Sinocyclocheilus grahami]
MGNSYTGHLQSTRFEEVLHNSIEASLRSNTVVPRPVFSQLYLEAEQRSYSHDGRGDEDDDEEDGSDSNSPPIPYQMKPPPDGCCTTDGFCQAGKDLRLSSMATESLEVPPGFLLIGAKSPSVPDHILVCAVDLRFLPDECGRNALLGFSGNCMGCGEKGFRYFTEFANHINLKLTTQPKKQKHLKYHLLRNAQGILVKGPPICWKGMDSRMRHAVCNAAAGPEEQSGHGPTDLLPNSGHAALNTINHADLNTHLHISEGSPPLTNGSHVPGPQQPPAQPGIVANGPGRPTVIGSMANSGPPKKRHKGWSPESSAPTEVTPRPAPTSTTNGTKSADSGASGCLSMGSSPHLAPGESVTVPDHLLQTCGLRPVIFKGHGTLPHLCGNLGDVLVSGLLQKCYRNSQNLPRVYEQYGTAPMQPISTEMLILLTVYYLVQLGKHQTRALAESLLSPNDCVREIVHELSSGMAAELGSYFSSLGPDGDVEALLEKASPENNVQYSSIEPSGDSPKAKCAGKHQTRALAESLLSPNDCVREIVHELSSGMAAELGSYFSSLGPDGDVEALLEKASPENNVQYSSIEPSGDSPKAKCAEYYVEWHEIRPIQLAVARKLLSHVCAIADSSTQNLDLGSFDKVEFLICVPPSEVTFHQVVLHLWNSGRNFLMLHVTSFPFTLQTQYTRISPYNEIHWPSGFNNDVDLYHEKTKYFGVSELLETTRSGSGLPLLRYDSSFESMAAALEDRFPKLHSAVIRTHVLIQHYSLALMVTAGGQALQALQKHISVETLEMVQCLLNTSQRCPSRHGHMLLLRIPSPALAAFAHQRLCHVRNRLGLHKQFEVILGDPCSALTVGKHFLDQLRVWLKILDPDWAPRTYLELEALPCILILTGMDPLGESLPRSLKYCDLRVISCWSLQRTTLEQELGLATYLLKTKQDGQHGPQPRCDLSESDPEKLSSTDNEDEEVVVDVNNDLPKLGNQASPAGSQHPQSDWTPLDPDKQPNQRRQSKSTSSSSSSTRASPLRQSCSWARNLSRPPVVLLPKTVYDLITTVDSSGLPKSTSFLPHSSVEWVSSFRPLLSKMMTCTEQSLYYRQWTVPKPHHMDSSNRAEGRTDNFHPRKLLLSGPPQVGKTGAYLQFLGILSRMLIRLMEVDIYDEEDINCNCEKDLVRYHQPIALWPNTDTVQGMPFDYTIHDPKYKDISTVYSPDFTPNSNDGNSRRQEDVYLHRRTARIKLSKYAAYNTYHHCEQCHQYMGFNPQYQLYESTLHAFTFSHLLLGEEIQLYFIIPKSKEHHFSFSQSGGQLESMRLPLTSDWNPDAIKSPIFTPTTGRHEHGLFNLYHAMEGATHLHILVIKEYEMAVYKKYWPNHIMLVLPTIFNGAGIGAAHFLIKELSYHNLELERSRRVEHGSRPQDVWPFIVLADDSCVMWNSVDVDPKSGTAGTERNVSLKQVLQHMESIPDITQYGLCGLRKWSSRGDGAGRQKEPFSRGHLHDFLLLNVDLTQNVQYNQNRFTCDDVDFNLRAHSAGLLICRFNNFSVMKKQIAIGGYGTFIIKTKVTDVPTTIQPTQYICAPDSKHLFLATPAQLLLEKYLQHTSHRLFPLSAQNYSHPVLSVDCYLNLGPEVTVCFVSSRPHSINFSTTGLLFSGLLLYFCDSFVTPGFLKKFQFLKGATLCVICPNRSSLRQTVVRLELEEEWRFRLSDEFQTANAKEDQPLFFLTGKHI